ncbi:histidine phosphatase family protein [Undibacterium cyanobacteriorum]|uniref:Histidine phosphatase family protein n=1 Tax=Undibacterium cyanobacteriorum TaxID=3073561 RepID=A0ABY9RGT9_9BURK|nr:histidine phosphatase family protein [Undibacterium sp. 20NA77.5]WMW80176.1 histidine phosphatase family protein [Undibacterium sp. 20NA77.5]
MHNVSPQVTELLLIRHGETAWNAVRRLQGHLDIGLNTEGQRQAQALGQHLATDKLAAIISSDLQRALHTAQAIADQQNIDVQIDARLRERCFGDFEGKLYSELPDVYPQEYALWRSRDPDLHFPAKPEDPNNRGESIREFHQRVIGCLRDYAAHYAGQRIALVAHGGVLECAWREASGLPLNAERAVTIFNASINHFRFENDRLQLIEWGQVAHLEKEVRDEIT